jgi:hypothetical protein
VNWHHANLLHPFSLFFVLLLFVMNNECICMQHPADRSATSVTGLKITAFIFHSRVSIEASEKADEPLIERPACSNRDHNVRPAMRVSTWSALTFLAFVLATAGNADAAEAGPPLRIGHYSGANGLIGFVLDRLGRPIKLRFDGSDEILALNPEPAPYDSVTLKRDDGMSVLRLYQDGQVLAFSDKLSGGSARVYRDQDAQPLAVKGATRAQAQADAMALGQKLKQAEGIALAVLLEAPHLADKSENWAAMADAVSITEAALVEMLASPIARQTIATKLRRVVIRDGGRVDIKLEDRTLVVEISAGNPIVGRPSSARLKSAIGDLL